jgi:hypothetical protein
MAMMLAGQKRTPETVSSGSLLLATEIALVLLCPLIMAYWYAPVLAGWHGLSPAKALFFSFVACLRNWRPFLVYSLAIGVVATLVPGIVLGILAALLPSGASLVLVLMMVLLILVLAPTLFASFYVSYRDVFVSADDDA